MTFTNLNLSDNVLLAIKECGYTTPTPIQAKAIPIILSGRDVLAKAQTGTGKTAAFTLPILCLNHMQLNNNHIRKIHTLILVPTRELALQVKESVTLYGKHTSLHTVVIIGGVNINPQIKQLTKTVDILIATPGRLLDHIRQKTLDISQIKVLVLDEADRMLDMGFINDIRKILILLPQKRQTLLFSATFSSEIKALTNKFLNNPILIEVTPNVVNTPLVKHKVHLVDSDKKRALLTHLILQYNWFQVLVFTKTKHGANKLAQYLLQHNIPALAIHGNKSQSARVHALNEFKNGNLQILVATDIAARGLDIIDLPHVVNFDLPHVAEDYVHRIGRTGRAGKTGDAVSLVSPSERHLLAAIEKVLKVPIEREIVLGFEPNAHAMSVNTVQNIPAKSNKTNIIKNKTTRHYR